MGIYAVTGGSRGIGEQAVKILRSFGHEVINIDIRNGDITADLGTVDGRELAISKVHERCPDGLDGFICNHGITGLPRHKLSYVLSVNYFGSVALMEGLYDLLKKKKGKCVVTISGSITHIKRRKYFVDNLLTNCGDEARITRLVDSFPRERGDVMYVSSKIALTNWVRRVSASWGANGVNINAVVPGAVATNIMEGYIRPDLDTYYYPMPMLYGTEDQMDPYDVGYALVSLVLPGAKGICGSVLNCDAGHAAILDPDRPI